MSSGSITFRTTASGGTLLILALDTSARGGSVAVVRGGVLAACLTGDPALTHAQRLPGDLTRALDAAGARLEDLDLLAVAVGPGSFTGLRIGIAAIQGLALSRGLRVVPVTTLEALARAVAETSPAEALVAPWLDAQRGEVFAALYSAGAGGPLMDPSSLLPGETLLAWHARVASRRIVFAGDGATRYRTAIVAALPDQASVFEPTPPLAPTVARIAAVEPGRAVLPHALAPLYVRRPDAELARERRSGPA